MAVDKSKIEEETSILRFYKVVLSWDYLRLLDESGKNSKNTAAGLSKVKDTYKNVKEYLATFEPLLFEEVKAQMVQGKDDEENTEYKLVVTNKCSEADGFHLLTFIVEEVESISQNDLLLLSDKQFGGKELPTKYAFGSVEHRQDSKHQVTVRMQLGGEIKSTNVDKIEPSARLSGMRALVSEQEKPLHIQKICSLSTIVREYVALRSISSLPFKDLILSASENIQTSEDQAWKVPKLLMESIQNNHNKSQLEAIHAGLSRRRFVLIQGPPGTGKTQTILGLLSAILHATPPRVSSKGILREIKRGPELPVENKVNQWEKASPWLSGINPRDAIMPEDGDDGFFPTSGNEMKPEVVKSSRKYRVRVLVCAPSNSALDEIVVRLLNTGLRDENDRPYNPKIVRIGLKPHHSVQTVSMDYIMAQKLSGMDFQTNDKTKQGGAGRERDTLRASILDEAAIVFSTLSFSGSALFSKLNRGFDVVIIDEAAQAVEAATLVPLANGCKQVFLVGDPVQLPATVISPTAEKLGYGMSLFKRFQKAGYQVVMLKTQYRMHPEIRSFPSREFYNGELEDGSDVVDQTKREWHEYHCFGPFCFFDIHEGKETQPSGSGSWVNEDEVNFVLALYHKLVTKYPVLSSSARLAIISPYRHQVKLIRERFKDMFGVESEKVVDINTVDGFQGREKDVAIFSCVRASKDKGIGFVADFRRMNVGITRARSAVLVVGSATTLKRDEHWKSLVESAEERNSLFKVSKPYKDFFSDENLKSMKVAKPGAEAEDMETDAPAVVYGDIDAVPAEDHYGGDGDGDGGYDMGGDDD